MKMVLRWDTPLSDRIEGFDILDPGELCLNRGLSGGGNNCYSYVYSGVRVHLAAMLDLHYYCTASFQEVCMTKYKFIW